MLSTTPTPQNRATRAGGRGLKTRVWGFCRRPATRAPVFGAQTTKPRRVAKAAATKTASGPSQWLSRDPIEEWGGINLYGYVLNNPLNLIDPLGMFPSEPIPDDTFESQFPGWDNATRAQNEQKFRDQISKMQEWLRSKCPTPEQKARWTNSIKLMQQRLQRMGAGRSGGGGNLGGGYGWNMPGGSGGGNGPRDNILDDGML